MPFSQLQVSVAVVWVWTWCCFQVADGLTFPFAGNDGATKKTATIQVCQNKDCCKRWSLEYQNLPTTLTDLLPPTEIVEVETTGCLSHCGKGPNLCIRPTKKGSKEVYINGMTGPMSLVVELEEQLGIQIPSKLVAAVTVMERAHKAPLSDKDRFYSSVINVLSSDEELSQSIAHARALSLRAQSRFEEGQWESAVEDAQASLEASSDANVAATAWRTIADCHKSSGRMEQAVSALRQWAASNPSYRTKVEKEIQELLA